MTITTTEYCALEQAFDYFNHRLFAGKLPACLLTLQRRNRMRGYYAAERFELRPGKSRTTDEIALNPVEFAGRSDKEILSTLVHEMAHQYQAKYGRSGRRYYHNREWAEVMERVGLMPSDTGEVGGKRTGQRMSHYIIAGGVFEQAYEGLRAGGFVLNWQSKPGGGEAGEESGGKRRKYECPRCGQKAWAKAAAQLRCGACAGGPVMTGED